jgi:glutamate-5-semialdehyde dehydrogenase
MTLEARIANLQQLTAGQAIVFGGNRLTFVDDALAGRFQAGDHLVVVQTDGALLHVPVAEYELATDAVDAALDAFHALSEVSDQQISAFFDEFARRLADDAAFATVADANAADVASASQRGRSTTRLVLGESMRAGMIDGLHMWRDASTSRHELVQQVTHAAWTVEAWRAPLGVVGFVFEGRPNVFADACGVLRSGNTAVFRIGSDALGTARAIMATCVVPALSHAGLPSGAVQLLDSSAHAAGWALFSDSRLGLAVARGSGPAVAQLGAVARQNGVAVSLHGTGGAWVIAAPDADAHVIAQAVTHSLDRKVCNTMNVCVLVGAASSLRETVIAAANSSKACEQSQTSAVIHDGNGRLDQLGHEFEWETTPEFWLVHANSVDEAVKWFNDYSPRFAASVITGDNDVAQHFYESVDAPFVGNGFTRWVDGQFALDKPELGLSNWQGGRLLARGGVLSGDSVHTVRLRAAVTDHSLHR